MAKPHQKLLAFNKIFYEMKKKYGLETAKEWLELEWKGALYMHLPISMISFSQAIKASKGIRQLSFLIKSS